MYRNELYRNELSLLGAIQITPEEILSGKEELFNLKHSGAIIKEIFDRDWGPTKLSSVQTPKFKLQFGVLHQKYLINLISG